ncbi:type II secretion system protein GspM [Pantoea dispersa]|uniref:type II secretion system protein GspM n=1 Tax=Pantoea dispersa TaxID=59814 RepID=UPI0039B49104
MIIIKNGWQSRSPREQRLLLLAGISLVAMLIFSAWQQLNQWRDLQRLAFEQEKRALSALIAQAAELPQPAQRITLEEINQRASEQGLALTLAPAPNGYRLTAAQPVAFQPLMQWLTQLENCCALHARQLVYERRADHRILSVLELTHAE